MGIEVANESGFAIDERSMVKQAAYVLDRLRIHPAAELSIVLLAEDSMAALHERWMDEVGPTDVMAFPMDEMRPVGPASPRDEGILGDVVICPQVAERQAAAAGHGMDDEMATLLAHGILHLLGYDHDALAEERLMFGLQGELVQELRAVRADG